MERGLWRSTAEDNHARSHDNMRIKAPVALLQRAAHTTGLAIVAILILGLLGGLFHHHESESDSAACSYCHASIQTPKIDLAAALIAPSFAAIGFVIPARVSDPPPISLRSALVPRAPPLPNHPAGIWDDCVDLG